MKRLFLILSFLLVSAPAYSLDDEINSVNVEVQPGDKKEGDEKRFILTEEVVLKHQFSIAELKEEKATLLARISKIDEIISAAKEA